MNIKHDEIPGMCRGMAHELSNVLSYMLPTIQEIGGFHRDLSDALSVLPDDHPAAPVLRPLAARFPATDMERMDRQLLVGGTRLSHFFRDLKLGFVSPGPEQLRSVDLRQALLGAVEVAPRPQALDLDADLAPPGRIAPPLLVEADPALLHVGLSRLLRAALGWARTARLQVPVHLSLLTVPAGEGADAAMPAPGSRSLESSGHRARVVALLPGDPQALPSPENLLDMLCPAESGAVRSERGPLGILIGAHLLRVHGGDLFAVRQRRGVALCAELPLLGSHSQ